MEVQLRAVQCTRALREEETAALLRLLPEGSREHYEKIKSRERRERGLLACGVLYALLLEMYGWKDLPQISRGKNGKPFFPEHPGICFNLSHTHDAVLVGVSDQSIGVDIEKLRPVSARLRTLFPQAGTEQEFWESWVKRESAVKRAGGSIMAAHSSAEEERFFSFAPFAGYAASVCTSEKTTEVKLDCFTVE